MKVSITSTERARLSQTMGDYLWLMEKYSDKVRYLPNVADLYVSATKQWTTLGLVKPSRAEAEKRDELFKACDARSN
ncbi:hypothetical protein A0H81_13721 [Grifola frondosa]|uniref:Uncharacterized protein n=1 Tax=Grifola frondosa TaxID=5627 RepID=A0A1C7LTT6_GRIFR|nr:hypothetical protein A0H81_13721 [Grifola frondosa]